MFKIRVICVITAALMLMSAAVVCPSAASSKYVKAKGGLNYSYAKNVLKIVNKNRKKKKAKKLVLDKALTKAAMIRAAELSYRYSHIRPNGKKCATAFKWQQMFGENIAHGEKSAKEVMYDWMHSPMHKKNILKKGYTRIGIGCFVNEYGEYYWTQVFSGGKKKAVCKTKGTKFVDVKIGIKGKAKTKFTVVKNVPKIKSVKVTPSEFVYDGNSHKLSVVVKDTKGKTVPKKFYSLYGSFSANKIGVYQVGVREIYRARYFTVEAVVKPPAPTGLRLTQDYYGIRASWNSLPDNDMEYELEYSRNSDFSDSQKIRAILNYEDIDDIRSEGYYYVRVRAFYYDMDRTVYSPWSDPQSIYIYD
jgi:hypothetical protein